MFGRNTDTAPAPAPERGERAVVHVEVREELSAVLFDFEEAKPFILAGDNVPWVRIEPKVLQVYKDAKELIAAGGLPDAAEQAAAAALLSKVLCFKKNKLSYQTKAWILSDHAEHKNFMGIVQLLIKFGFPYLKALIWYVDYI